MYFVRNQMKKKTTIHKHEEMDVRTNTGITRP